MRKLVLLMMTALFMLTAVCSAGESIFYPVLQEKKINNREAAEAFYKHFQEVQNTIPIRDIRDLGGFNGYTSYDWCANDNDTLMIHCRDGYVLELTLHMQQESYIKHGTEYFLALLAAADYDVNNPQLRNEAIKAIDYVIVSPFGQAPKVIYNAKTKRNLVLSKHKTYDSTPMVYIKIGAKPVD